MISFSFYIIFVVHGYADFIKDNATLIQVLLFQSNSSVEHLRTCTCNISLLIPACSELLRLLVKHYALQLPCYLFFRLFRNIGGFGAKQYFTVYRTADKVQLVVAVKGNVSGLFFYRISRSKLEFPWE